MKVTVRSLQAQNYSLAEDNQKLRKELEELRKGAFQQQKLVDSLMGATAEKYGIKVEDEGQVIGYRLEIPVDRVAKILGEYEAKADRNELVYTFGIVKIQK